MTTTPIPPSSSGPLAQLKHTGRLLAAVASVAVLVATLLTLWTPTALLSNTFSERVNTVLRPEQATPTTHAVTAAPESVLPIGIIGGHTGNPPDAGAVCPDGLKEVDINAKIATLVRQNLVNLGYTVDLLEEWDDRLKEYKALVLVSIHNDSCDYINNEATGFKVAAARASANDPAATRLTNCLIDRYGKTTGLPFHYNSITPDMTDYHNFNEIHTSTPAAIIETGFLNLDRDFLIQHTDVVAQGITAGILCFINNEPVLPTPEPTTQTTP